MGRLSGALLGASLLYLPPAWADTVVLAIPAPIPAADFAMPSLPDLHLMRLAPGAITSGAETTSNHTVQISEQADINAFGFSCEETLTVRAAADAMLEVHVSAPCRPGQVVRISYVNIGFDLSLSMTGDARTMIPAMAYQAELDSIFDDYSVLTKQTNTPELNDFARTALSWDDAGDAYLSGQAPRHLPIDVITLGDGSGRVMQVLSHQIDPDARPGVVRLTMIAPVTEQNCGMQREGHVLQHMPDLPTLSYDLTLAAAGCDKVGTNLELKNILQDMKLASN